MQSLFDEWKFKHVQPNDLHNHFGEYSSKNIDWFFNDVIQTTKKMDYSANKIKNNKLLVKNKGELTSPISVTGFLKNKIIFTFWEDGFTGNKWIELPEEKFDKVIINYNYNTIDIKTTNNTTKDKK